MDRLKGPVLVILFLFCINALRAQKKSFAEGYIIAHSGDTIPGWVKDRSPEPFVTLYNKIRFKQEGRGRTRKYGPDDILGYGYHGMHFMSLPFREENGFFTFRYYTDVSAPRVFLKVIATTEKLMYFEQLFVHDDNSYLDAFPLFYRPGSNEMVRVTQGIFGFKRKRLRDYFSDCPALVEEMMYPNSKIRTVPELYGFLVARCDLKYN